MEEDSRRVETVRMGSNPDVRASSSWWASRGSNAFWSSAREEDDEEVLRWAAIEKLPTYDRMRKGILTAVGAGMQEVDIQGLSMQERKCLIQRLIRIPEEDNERFLLKLRERMERRSLITSSTSFFLSLITHF